MLTLYGDGIHSDAPAIQEMLDTMSEIALPEPKVCYRIDRTLRIGSNKRLLLPRFAVIRLADGVNTYLLTNADRENGDVNIEIRGGVWDFNNLGQEKNPLHYPHPDYPAYDGVGIHFLRVRGLTFAGLTLKDPVTFASGFDTVSDFTIEDIVFDFNYGNPKAVNMDGVHLYGNCHRGVVRNLKGACYDDLVALNADEGSNGPISDIDIDGIFAEDCHSAVRLLTVRNCVENIHIHNVFGSFYQYCIGVTKYYGGETEGVYDALVFDNIHASKAVRYSVYCNDGAYVYPFIWIEKNLRVRHISVSELYRREEHVAIPTIYVGENSVVEHMTLRNIVCENLTGEPFPLIELHGEVKALETAGLDAGSDEILRKMD